MIWSIAWRNVWRNKVRSAIVLLAVAIGLFAGVFSTGFFKGMIDMRMRSAIKTETSHIQIHKKDYKLNYDLKLFMTGTDELLADIKARPDVAGVSRRLISECIVTTAHGTRGVKLVGIEPEREGMVTDIFERITEGKYLDHDNKRTAPILVGESLAEDLKLKLKSKITVDLVDAEGHITTKLFKVAGIFRTSNTGYDDMNVFVKREDLLNQLALEQDVAHEIAIYLNPDTDLKIAKEEIQAKYSELEVLSWRQISKELALMADSMDQYMYIFVLIIMLALCFGIINTMLMVVLERTKELGMLMAVGMNKMRVFFMIVLESIFLSLSGGVLGIIIGYLVIKHFETTPIVLDMFEGFEQYGYSTKVYTSIDLETLIGITIMVIFLGIFSAIYPARKATKLDPADAIRTD
ncbi:ABC transporter permease [Bacteroidota bacterium]